VLEAGRAPAGAEEIETARAGLESDLARAGDGAPARARRLGFERVIARDAHDRERYLQVIRTLTPGALRAAVAPFVDQRGLVVAVALPQGTPGGRDDNPAAVKPRLEAALRTAAGSVPPQAAPAVASGDAVRMVTAGGVRVLVLRDVTSPLVSVEAAWIDRAETGGSADDAAPLLAALLGRGTRTRSAADVAAEMQALGGTLTGFTAPGTLGLRAVFFPRHLERGLALMADTLAYPAFAESEMDAAARAVAASGERRPPKPACAAR
jgi:zinc protease